MIKREKCDAIIIGSGPNGLAAGIKLAQAGLSVVIFESKETVGGGMRSAELTLPGFVHDICSAVHPLGIGSPFFRTLPLDRYGLEWIQPPICLAHPFDDGTSAHLERSLADTGKTLGIDDEAYQKLMKPFVKNWNELCDDLLAPLHFPRHPLLMAQFGIQGIRPAYNFSKNLFKSECARCFFAGLSAHSILPLDEPLTTAIGLILAILGHTNGWPIPKGGSQKIADALASYFCSLGGKICTGEHIDSIDNLPPSKVILCDITPRQLLQIAGNRLPSQYKRKLENYRYGPGVFKIDWALNSPIPWKSVECTKSGTIHLGGSLEEIFSSEREVWKNEHPQKPFVIIAQPSLFDQTRAPKDKHTAWGYCHVPNGSNADMTERIESQIERFAPGFKDCIMAKSIKTAMDLERYNPNYVGGDINGGVLDIYQLFMRPAARIVPYSTPLQGLYICSSSTPPGGGVHGMCGYHAACAVLKKHFN